MGIGDWARFGEKKGFTGKYVAPAVYDELEQATGYNRRTIQEFKTAAERTSTVRTADLTFNHHKEVAPLEPEQQEHFLNRASEEKLSVPRLILLGYFFSLIWLKYKWLVGMKKTMQGSESLIFNNEVTTFTLLDFWRWSESDLLSNTTRGRFAEFIVATAIGLHATDVREEWANYDLITPKGIKVEVKSAAYIQSWEQTKKSRIVYKVRPTHAWDFDLKKRQPTKELQADVYVFCLLYAEDKAGINPLDLSQWEFYILSTEELIKHFSHMKTIPLKKLKQISHSKSYGELSSAINDVKKTVAVYGC